MFFYKRDLWTGGYLTTARNINIARRFFAEQPDGQIETGMWDTPYWTKGDFYHWFRRCLMLKCGGGEYTARQREMIGDGYRINRYMAGNRSAGTGFLSSVKMQRRYPHINNQVFDF